MALGQAVSPMLQDARMLDGPSSRPWGTVRASAMTATLLQFRAPDNADLDPWHIPGQERGLEGSHK